VRVAGFLLALLGMLNLGFVWLGTITAAFGGGDASRSTIAASSFVDLSLGLALAMGPRNRWLVPFAALRVLAGAVFYGFNGWTSGDPAAPVSQVVVAAGFLLLLVGSASVPRAIAGTALALLGPVLATFGPVLLLHERSPVAGIASRTLGYGAAVERIEGPRRTWSLSLPAGRWRPPSALRRPGSDAGVVHELGWPLERALLVVHESRREGASAPTGTGWELPSGRRIAALALGKEQPLASDFADAKLAQVSCIVDGTTAAGYLATYVDGDVQVQVLAVARSRSSPERGPSAALRRIAASLSPVTADGALVPPLEMAIRAAIELEGGCLKYAKAELDGDGTPEVLAFIEEPEWCQDGCTAVAYRREGSALRKVWSSARVRDLSLLEGNTPGSNDLCVWSSTGLRRVRLDGTLPSADPVAAGERNVLDGARSLKIDWIEACADP
jgi:hypothetical protein